MSDNKKIDRLFQEKFKDFEVTPDKSVWKSINANLNKKKASIMMPSFIFFNSDYRTPCISFLSNGCSAKETRPRAIGTIVKIKKK